MNKFANAAISIERELIGLFRKQGAYFVVSAGNPPHKEYTNLKPGEPMSLPIPKRMFPAAHKYDARVPDDLEHLIIAGGAESATGRNAYYSADFVKLYAPVDPMCLIDLEDGPTSIRVLNGATSGGMLSYIN
ncbi:hypothetical protein TWF696_004029 [Orbilia brochopaga]|uniref:Uncharacterized protein n=1 Tax=Orbilia brochopaga TaxID=3140254 RepID=A0AAV9V8L0_9PEZI